MTVKMRLNRNNSQNEETRVQIFAQQMLTSRIFVASFIGRFYVESLKAYRDVIQIYGEKELTRDLDIVKKRINKFYKGAIWAAITTPEEEIGIPDGYCIWVDLQNIPLATYWFMMEDLTFSDSGEVIIKVKVVRKFESNIKTAHSTNTTDGPKEWQNEFNTLIFEMKNNLFSFVHEIITWHNIKESSRFIFILLMTVGTALLYGLQYLGDFSIRLFREFSHLIQVSTPIFLGVLDLLSKVIGGLFILIAMLWRGNGPVPGQFASLQAPPPNFNRIRPGYYKRS